jgi:hypothetical protein
VCYHDFDGSITGVVNLKHLYLRKVNQSSSDGWK